MVASTLKEGQYILLIRRCLTETRLNLTELTVRRLLRKEHEGEILVIEVNMPPACYSPCISEVSVSKLIREVTLEEA